MAAHARLKNEFTEDGKYHNVMRWLNFTDVFQICYVEQRVVYGQTLVFAGCKERTVSCHLCCLSDEPTLYWPQGKHTGS